MQLFSDPRYNIMDMDYKTRQKDYEQKVAQKQPQLTDNQQKQLLKAAEYYNKLKELDERLKKIFQKFAADNLKMAQNEINQLNAQLNSEFQNYVKELSAAFEQKNQELYKKYSNELAQLTQARIGTMQAMADRHTIITNYDLAQQKQQEYDNAVANLKIAQEKLIAEKKQELDEKAEGTVAKIMHNIAQQSGEQKAAIEDYIGDFTEKVQNSQNIELVINELDSFIQQFEDTPTA